MKKLLFLLLIAPLFFISSCEEQGPIHGCLDSQACNYNPEATLDNNSCEYAIEGFDCDDVIGCTDSLACNFNSEAIANNNSCEYALQGYDCDGNITEYIVGMEAEGGIVFYLDETGEHGLVAALEDLGQFEWGCYEESVDGADRISIGTGYQNTMDIVNQGCVTENLGITAAQAALDAEINGYSDWYLPSRDELYEMYNTIGSQGNIGGFATSGSKVYWSSSEESINNSAWFVFFSDGSMYHGSKYNAHRVRVIRAF